MKLLFEGKYMQGRTYSSSYIISLVDVSILFLWPSNQGCTDSIETLGGGKGFCYHGGLSQQERNQE